MQRWVPSALRDRYAIPSPADFARNLSAVPRAKSAHSLSPDPGVVLARSSDVERYGRANLGIDCYSAAGSRVAGTALVLLGLYAAKAGIPGYRRKRT